MNKRDNKDDDEENVENSCNCAKPTIVEESGTKRTASKVSPSWTTEPQDEPEAKRPKEDDATNKSVSMCLEGG